MAAGSSLISVIVPCYNTVRYLDECLESIIRQTFRDLEIIVVDDGSTDSTADVLAAWARRDERITLISRPNGGLGAARNTGLEHATGEFLAFVDSDDVLPDDALERMVGTIERTGSDFVSGVADRFDDTGRWRASLYRRGFREDLDRTHVYERPSLLNDHIVCSKLFRRSFWNGRGLRFPEGTLFEDIEVATRAHCLADSVDLLAEPTYLWRSRSADDPSITQDRRRPGSVTARFSALASTDAFVRDTAPPNVWRRHGMKIITIDLPLYARELTTDDPEFCDEFFDAAHAVLAGLSPAALESLGPMHRLLYEAVGERSVTSTRALTALLKSDGLRDRFDAYRALSWSARRNIARGAIRRRVPWR